MATLVLSVIGDDRTGLVDALAGPIAAHGGNWDRSHLARLESKFAGIVVVTLPDRSVDDLRAALEGIQAQGLLDVRIAIAGTDEPGDATLLRLHLVGQDRPGIIAEISAALARRQVGIDELETTRTSAPMSAEHLFEARAVLRVPAGTDVADLHDALEDIANELMVDLDVRFPDDGSPDDGSTDDGSTDERR